eukprot:515871-Alexandrium_andersonii.AAC.1
MCIRDSRTHRHPRNQTPPRLHSVSLGFCWHERRCAEGAEKAASARGCQRRERQRQREGRAVACASAPLEPRSELLVVKGSVV